MSFSSDGTEDTFIVFGIIRSRARGFWPVLSDRQEFFGPVMTFIRHNSKQGRRQRFLPVADDVMKVENLGQLDEEFDMEQGITLYGTPIEAGFPSPADDHVEEALNLNSYLVRNRTATFFLRASGTSMIDAGIHDGDLLIVDRSLHAESNRIVIAAIEGELTVKRLVRRKDGVFLVPANPLFQEIDITENEYVYIWGVVTYVIHKV